MSFDACVIFRFDDDSKILLEDHYADALTTMRQLDSSSASMA